MVPLAPDVPLLLTVPAVDPALAPLVVPDVPVLLTVLCVPDVVLPALPVVLLLVPVALPEVPLVPDVVLPLHAVSAAATRKTRLRFMETPGSQPRFARQA